MDLVDVRVHNGPEAASLARSLNARSFTFGRHHIVFDNGHYAPRTTEGRSLLAHELAHVAQQRRNGRVTLQRKTQRATAEYLDSDLCYLPGRTEGPTNSVLGRWVGVLETPESCPGEIRMTTRFEMIGDWGLERFVGPSASRVKWTVNVLGIDPGSVPKGERTMTGNSFEQSISIPVTPESCSANFLLYQLVGYRPSDGFFAEIGFTPQLRRGSGAEGRLIDESPAPTIRVDHCGRLEPTNVQPPPGWPGPPPMAPLE